MVILLCSAGYVSAGRNTQPPPLEIQPPEFGGEVCEAECVEEALRITIPEAEGPTVSQLDVAFVMDVSGSMGAELDTVKDQSNAIMQGVRDVIPDSAFAAASFVDYPDFRDPQRLISIFPYGSADDYPWQLDQDVTSDVDRVSQALSRIVILNGEDDPEAYSRALYEAQFLS